MEVNRLLTAPTDEDLREIGRVPHAFGAGRVHYRPLVPNDSLSLKSSANCRAELTEHIARIDDEDVQTLFMVLGSDDSFLDSLNANDPDFSKTAT